MYFATAGRFLDRYIERNSLKVIKIYDLVYYMKHGEGITGIIAEMYYVDYSRDVRFMK